MLINGDCLQELPKILPDSISMVLVDMPYGTTKLDWDQVISIEALWPLILGISKNNAAILFFADEPFSSQLIMSNLGNYRYKFIWEKTRASGYFNAKKMPLKAHEEILVFYQALPTYNPQKTHGHPRKVAQRKPSSTLIYGKDKNPPHYDSTSRYPRSVLRFAQDTRKSSLHPTQKPVDLLRYLIKTYTNPGDVVLDFCMGSGSTGVAAYLEGRGFVGIEIDPVMFDVAARRIGGVPGISDVINVIVDGEVADG